MLHLGCPYSYASIVENQDIAVLFSLTRPPRIDFSTVLTISVYQCTWDMPVRAAKCQPSWILGQPSTLFITVWSKYSTSLLCYVALCSGSQPWTHPVMSPSLLLSVETWWKKSIKSTTNWTSSIRMPPCQEIMTRLNSWTVEYWSAQHSYCSTTLLL